jgi:thiamine-phosphate diphosphorylase
MVPGFDLLIITDGRPSLLDRLERALSQAQPGRVAVLLREPTLATSALLATAIAARRLTRAAQALLLVSGRVDVALVVEADGVHLPERGVTPAYARSLLGERALIGASRHDAQGLVAAQADGADYATLSPVHHVEGKALPLGIDGFAALRGATELPVYALGGVKLSDVPALLAVGAHGVAVMREVLSADDPGASTRQLLAALAER